MNEIEKVEAYKCPECGALLPDMPMEMDTASDWPGEEDTGNG